MNAAVWTGRIAASALALCALLIALVGCESTDGGETPATSNGVGDTARSPQRTSSTGQRQNRRPPAAPDWVDREVASYKTLFDGGDYDALSPSRRRLVSAGTPGVRFLVQFLLARTLARPTGEIGSDPQEVADRVSSIRRHAEMELLSLGEPSFDYLSEISTSAQTDVARQAARILAFHGEPGVAVLGSSLGKAEERWRKIIVDALGTSGEPRAVRILERTLGKDPSWQVRGTAAAALGPLGRDVGAEAVIPILERAARADQDEFIVQKCAESIVEIDKKLGLPGALICLERFMAQDPPQLAAARAVARWMMRRSGLKHGLDTRAWRRAIRG